MSTWRNEWARGGYISSTLHTLTCLVCITHLSHKRRVHTHLNICLLNLLLIFRHCWPFFIFIHISFIIIIIRMKKGKWRRWMGRERAGKVASVHGIIICWESWMQDCGLCCRDVWQTGIWLSDLTVMGDFLGPIWSQSARDQEEPEFIGIILKSIQFH